jgi:hypothetical protein
MGLLLLKRCIDVGQGEFLKRGGCEPAIDLQRERTTQRLTLLI